MVSVHRSETGTFVVVDTASGITVTGESLDEAWARLQESVVDPPSATAATRAQSAPPRATIALVVLALLPFAWLLLASDTIEQTLEESRAVAAAADSDARADDPTVLELKRLSKQVSALQREVDKLGKRGRSRSKDDSEDEDESENERENERERERPSGAAATGGRDAAKLEATRDKLRARTQRRRKAAAQAGETGAP